MHLWRKLIRLLLIAICVTPCFGSEGETEVHPVGSHDAGLLQVAAVVPEQQKTPPVDPLTFKVERAIAATNFRVLTAGQHTPWQIVHAVLGLKHDCILNTIDGKKISGLEWLATSKYHEGVPLWEKTPYGGRGHPFTRPYAFEGHPTQFLGYMCMADLPLDYRFITADDSPITVREIVNDAKMQLREGPEVTWTLWALAHYLPPDSEWINAYGEAWSIERMVQIQTHESVLNAACGGTHGLFVLSYARNRYIATNKPLRGVWLEADQKIQRFIHEAKAMQNSDGSFSADYFQAKRSDPEFSKRLPANGHMLEWLMIALPQKELKEEWVRRGVESVAEDLYNNRKVAVDCGPLYHAVDALNLYNYRTNPNSRPLAYPISGKRRLEAQTASLQKSVESQKSPSPDSGRGSEQTSGEPTPTSPKSASSELEVSKTPASTEDLPSESQILEDQPDFEQKKSDSIPSVERSPKSDSEGVGTNSNRPPPIAPPPPE